MLQAKLLANKPPHNIKDEAKIPELLRCELTSLRVIDKDGKTVGEINTHKAKLSGKRTTVRGKVVKYNASVMGKNWLHIRDGSGGADSNDLTITTATEAKVGDTVLVSGKVATNRDFGGGYKYSVIIEDATVVVE